ncbi:hypothetical protein J5N97_019992 [Dioscorea zingiberensis]|uniref:Transmembrane protein 18 n=1 Tax=Dioscorea zingiberensis TaxID=325984 RepID=A0A9D5HDD9_9LILI|nr:hypothetical protein J5N97_019992 [Dioscorea zingiberensis]
MEDLRSALKEHADLVSHLFEKFSTELRTGFQPAYDEFIGFFHAIDWKEPWLVCLIAFHVALLLVVILSRRRINFQLCLFFLAFSGVFLAEKINNILGKNWDRFAGQNYFDPNGLFISVLWSGPLLITTIIILVNTLLTLCQLIVKWKRAELRHRARLSRGKQD